ncbi:hypothetical protein N8013_06690 [Algibacter sp.]|nr:hypothetical protein [Algibacter sp.]MDA9069640.1 hypothetical protein [Algibacter sp.]MDC1227320.1 hypothetical protein [Algibacter sp.]MDC1365302.1 hypothetical protein [Algibacter sp.]
MSSEQIIKTRALIEEAISRMQPLKPLMREDELEDFEYYESFDITNYTEKKICLSILERLTIIETRLLKKNNSNFYH